ncbi:MAG TPA: DNA alkylation repair protein [Acidobacteriaceae bacterium]
MKREAGALRDPERARFLQRFFRTGPGEYAEGDRLLGLTVPDQRAIARAYRALPLGEIEKLLLSPFHEHRLIALLILVDQQKRASGEGKRERHEFYLCHLDRVNHWDLVDISAAALVGVDPRQGLRQELCASPDVWHRRIAIVSTFAELRAGRTQATFEVAEALLGDRHDLIHKATGWLLREAGKRSPEELAEFLRRCYAQMPRTTLRYAIERMDPAERRKWLAGPQ